MEDDDEDEEEWSSEFKHVMGVMTRPSRTAAKR